MALFSEIIGQEHIKEHLQGAIMSKMASHAYIISGEEGMGKKMIAKAFAQGLLCERGDSEPCMTCHSCKQFLSNNHPDVKVIVPEKSHLISVEEVRKQIVYDVEIKPYSSEYKIYIVPDAQRMNEKGMNALLKTLEEPPKYAVILLLCTSSSLMLDTIVSRCVTLDIRPLKDSVVCDYLMKNVHVPDYKASVIASFARGNIGRALRLAQDEEFDELRKLAADILRDIKTMDPQEIKEATESILGLQTPPEEFLDYLALWFRDVLMYKSTHKTNNLLFKEDFRLVETMSNNCGFTGIERVIQEISSAKDRLRVNVNKESTIELVLMEIKES